MPTAESIARTVERAIAEDLGSGDLTASLIPEDMHSKARVITRENAVLCGRDWFDEVFRQLDARVSVEWVASDGDDITPEQTLCRIEGPTRALLTGERTALNFLQSLSGTATAARTYAKLLEGTGTKLLDTRKTIPGLREAQKYAVRCGGAQNHRMGLYDGILIKENHILACGSIGNAVRRAKALYPQTPVEAEVENLEQLREAIDAGADILLLDNFDTETMAEAVRVNQGRAKLEASGGLDREQLRRVAQTGVDFISSGALTKHLRAVDLSMRFLD